MNIRLILLGALTAAACRSQPEPVPAPARGATDVGTPQALPGDSRYVPAADRRAAVFPPAWRHQAGRAPVFGAHAMVASDSPLGSAAGVEILRSGGNAVDAGVATILAASVIEFSHFSIGGEVGRSRRRQRAT